MIVHGEVCKARVPALKDLAMNERWRERPVPVASGDVVGAEFGRLHVLDQQTKRRAVSHDTCAQNCAVFVPIAWIQVVDDATVILGPHQDVAGPAGHGSSSMKCSTLRNFATAFWG